MLTPIPFSAITPAFANSKNENLQILRFVAAALVLVTHITFYIHERVDAGLAVWHNGEIGVPIFFVISGFVMQLSSDKFEKSPTGATDFLRRRLARIFPLYWLITTAKIAIALIIPAAILHNQPTLLTSLGSYVLFPMFNAAGEVRPIHGVAWTLLHEMFFYYIFSFALFLRISPLVWVSVSIIILWLVGYIAPPTTAVMAVLTDKINLMFVAGMVIAWLHKRGFRLPVPVAAVLLMVSVGAIIVSDFTYFKRNYLLNIHVEAAILVFSLLNLEFNKLAKLRHHLSYLGDTSYSLYLVHPILAPAVILILGKIALNNIPTLITLTTIIAIFGAVLIFEYIEKPLTAAANRLLKIPKRNES